MRGYIISVCDFSAPWSFDRSRCWLALWCSEACAYVKRSLIDSMPRKFHAGEVPISSQNGVLSAYNGSKYCRYANCRLL
jgi:hypothetical protein